MARLAQFLPSASASAALSPPAQPRAGRCPSFACSCFSRRFTGDFFHAPPVRVPGFRPARQLGGVTPFRPRRPPVPFRLLARALSFTHGGLLWRRSFSRLVGAPHTGRWLSAPAPAPGAGRASVVFMPRPRHRPAGRESSYPPPPCGQPASFSGLLGAAGFQLGRLRCSCVSAPACGDL